jgi:hypothetical protein
VKRGAIGGSDWRHEGEKAAEIKESELWDMAAWMSEDGS